MFRVISPVPDNWPLVLTFDGKGIVMLPGALRPATAKAAAAAEGSSPRGCRPGRRTAAALAELACVDDAAPVPRPPKTSSAAGTEEKKKKRRPANRRRRGRASRESRRRGASG